MSRRRLTTTSAVIAVAMAGLCALGRPACGERPAVAVAFVAMDVADRDAAGAVTRDLVASLSRGNRVRPAAGAATRFRVVGTCHRLDSHLVVAVRLLDGDRSAPVKAETLLGTPGDMTAMLDDLADRLSSRIVKSSSEIAAAARTTFSTGHLPSRRPVSRRASVVAPRRRPSTRLASR